MGQGRCESIRCYQGEVRSEVENLVIWRCHEVKVEERVIREWTSSGGWAGQYASGRSH